MRTEEIIHKLSLVPHPEGGFYRETYRSKEDLITEEGKRRNVCTAIYYLLKGNDKSFFHRLKSEEAWFFHEGNVLEINVLINGEIERYDLGTDIHNGEYPQVIIPANTWFAAKAKSATGHTLVSCTVAPGFDFEDFELAAREELLRRHPHLEEVIKEFTKADF
ncbi:cupin domain-containing protein [Solitalea canadensis]|uniref:DUF985 domain-containing protein n=1 Tax=Solitalea canadensis (strain ATCC 29591 / DSM 3403 / JCM 21819 / LMG 8368 / NBRC 15130 / NCIMB 12057 / USAM 9D) TaxID=929556 RepID=H8KLH2_SOLCM|nr:cupin domain-containing protein [Solitalea canadensis]AFD08859.1 hypothetical protein Solca_3862 [Solitalea canadensis DSM 3403]